MIVADVRVERLIELRQRVVRFDQLVGQLDGARAALRGLTGASEILRRHQLGVVRLGLVGGAEGGGRRRSERDEHDGQNDAAHRAAPFLRRTTTNTTTTISATT